MSQTFTWKCKGGCGTMFSDEDWTFKKRWCDECLNKKKIQKYKESKEEKFGYFVPVKDMILYALKRQPCNAHMFMAYTNSNKQRVIDIIVKWRRIYKIPLDTKTKFYTFGGLK